MPDAPVNPEAPTVVAFVKREDGSVLVQGVTFVKQEDGSILWGGAKFSKQADGSFLVS